MPAQIHTGYAEINGTKLYYEVAGEGHPFTLIHGGLVDRQLWDDQFDVFAQHYRVIRYDIRGFGNSSVPTTEDTPSPRPQEQPALPRLADIHAPTLVIIGDEDVVQIQELAETFATTISGAKKAVIHNTAHHPNMEQPEQFNHIVLDFLSSLQ